MTKGHDQSNFCIIIGREYLASLGLFYAKPYKIDQGSKWMKRLTWNPTWPEMDHVSWSPQNS